MATSKIRATGQWTADGDVALNSFKITGLANGTNTGDAVNKSQLDAIIAAADALVYKGVIDCSGNPNYPAADAGHTYKVSVQGKIGGASGPNVAVGDLLICTTDGTATGDHATVGQFWDIVHVSGSLPAIDAQSVLANPTGASATPIAVTVAEQTLVGRITGGNVDDLSVAQVKTLLGGLNFADREVPSGVKNGTNPTFTLANTPVSGSEHVYLNGQLLNVGAGNDYTIATNTLTMLTGKIPVSTDVLLCSYRY